MEITLTKLSLNDTNLTFDYIYIDVTAEEHPGSNTLIVYGTYLMISVMLHIIYNKVE